jgi:hypothetical protein
MKRVAFAAACLAAAMAAPALAEGPKYNLTIAGYSPGGLVSTVGAGLDRGAQRGLSGLDHHLSDLQRRPRQRDAAEPEEGAARVHRRPPSSTSALKGRPPIKTPLANLRMLFHPYSPSSRFQATHFLANKDWADKHGIKTFADIVAKKPPMRWR